MDDLASPVADRHPDLPAEASALVTRAWELCYLDPIAARAVGRLLVERTDGSAGMGWLHVALAEARIGDATVAEDALRRAREALRKRGDLVGLALCDEVQAILLRRAGDYSGAAALQAAIDATGVERDPMHGFIAHNSRGITALILGDSDANLQHAYAASDYATRTGWPGPRITASSNLGGYHHTLFNLEDARQISEEALAEARRYGVRQTVGSAASNLIVMYYASGEVERARAMVEYMVTHEHELMPGALVRHALALAQGHLGVGEVDAAMGYLEAGAVTGISSGDAMTQWAWLKARCLLLRGDATAARSVAETTLHARQQQNLRDQPYDLMELYRVLADVCEMTGDSEAGLTYMRLMHTAYEQLVGCSARARFIAIKVTHQLAEAQAERDQAVRSRHSAEEDSRRLEQLNLALQGKIAETEMLHTRLREQALRDPLTGLHNRRYLFEVAPGLLELSRRRGASLCLVMMDLDHFKSLNDTYGHDAGDLVLQRFSTLLKQMLRCSDIVVRHGGEEFVAVMPDIDDSGAKSTMLRLLDAFRAQRPEFGARQLPGASFSAGVALHQRDGNSLEQLLSRADLGLYAAKHKGRARIEFAPVAVSGSATQ